MANSTAFRQEIARFEINVERTGKETLPLTQVPRLEKNDVLKVRLLEEQVNGMKPDQSNWNWTLLVAFINPARNNEKESVASNEIQFRKTGWYKEYSFSVPYDSQPVIFLYTKPNYRSKILNLVTKNQDEIRKIGEKTIELSDAYAKIGSFLNELQYVINRYQYTSAYGNYGSYGAYNNYGNYGSYNNGLNTGFNQSIFTEQLIERLARGFNIQLPNCWQNGANFGAYGNYGNNGVYNNNGYNNYGTYNPYPGYNNGSNNYGFTNDFIGRAQCVAKSVRLEDFDLSVSRMLQQGGVLGAAQLVQKYPQIAFWINVAAAALDLILKITKKTPLRLVPTVIASTEGQAQTPYYQQYSASQPNQNYQPNGFAPPGQTLPALAAPRTAKISLYAEAPPNESNFVTAYPLVVQKWQANPDPEVLSLPVPGLAEPCLRIGQNILKSSDVLYDWTADNFTKDFKLLMTSANGFRKEFPLKKNNGTGGWELILTKEDLISFPKISMGLDSVITGRRGFNEIRSPKFELALPTPATWEIEGSSQTAFAVGGKRRITLKNSSGNCRCLQAIIYKPSFGGQFIFEAGSRQNSLEFSPDGREVSFELDTTNFQPSQGTLELRQYSGEVSTVNLNLYPLPPNITELKVSRGDRQINIKGERLEQIRSIKVNGKRAVSSDASVNAVSPATANNLYASPQGNSSTATTAYQGNNPYASSGTVQTSGNNNYIDPTDRPGRQPSGNSPSSYPIAVNQNNQPPIPQQNINSSASSGNSFVLTERTFVFEDPNARQDSNNVSLEIELEGNRIYQNQQTFGVTAARPAILANEAKEVEAVALLDKTERFPALRQLPVFPINTRQISVNVQNILTDYDFKSENIQVEARIENSQINLSEMSKVDAEILDWKNMQITFVLNEQLQRFLGGRRLQFRIRDRVRGDSDWYTLRSIFVRTPEIKSILCLPAMKENCEIKGTGIEYISQVSIDGGKSWYPQEPATLVIQTSPDGQKTAVIPRYSNKKLLRIRLRDFRINEGLTIDNVISAAPGR